MPRQTINLGPAVDYNLQLLWEGSVEIVSGLRGSEARYLRRVQLVGTSSLRLYFSVGSSDTPSDPGQDLTTAWETYEEAITFEVEGGASVTVPGPDHSSNEFRDSSEDYFWTTPSDSGIATWFATITSETTGDLLFTLFDGIRNVPHSDTHVDSPHVDVAHIDDSHSDEAHEDQHVDGEHIDDPHEDIGHIDDVHVDTHVDDAHIDDPHIDTDHFDDPPRDSHVDTSHTDVIHEDIAHDDTVHDDDHLDTPHDDISHDDSPYIDVAHVDTHDDQAHNDTAPHTDIVHVDTDHQDRGYIDIHTDEFHSDSHRDSHIDTAQAGERIIGHWLLEFVGTDYAVWSGSGNLVYEGKTYRGAAQFMDLSVLDYQVDQPNRRLSAILAAGNEEIQKIFISDSNIYLVEVIWLVSLDGGLTYQNTGRKYLGRTNGPTYANGQYSVEIEPTLSDQFRQEPRYWSDEEQQATYPGDLGLSYASELVDGLKKGRWPR